MDWKATLINSIKSQPGRNGVPLNYVIRENVAAIAQTNTNFLDDYVDRNPLNVRFFNADASKVHLYIVRLIYDFYFSEHKLLPHKDEADGCVDY